jgi:hypothetical protein
MSALLANEYNGTIVLAKSSRSSSKSGKSKSHSGTSITHKTGSSHHSHGGSILGGILALALVAAVVVVAVLLFRRRRHSARPAAVGRPGFATGGGLGGRQPGAGKSV